MTSVSYAVGPGNASQEYFSNISSVLGFGGVLSGRHKPFKGRCYLSNGAWLTPSFCPSMRWVQPRFPEAPSGCRTDALRSGARRGGASVRRVPLRSAEEICGAPSPYPCRSEGERRLPSQLASQPANQPSTKELNGASLPHRKKVKRLTYEATPNSARVKKLCFQPAQAHSQGRYRRIHVL